MRKLCCIVDHQNKSKAYAHALSQAGYISTDRLHAQGIRFLLTDADWRRFQMEEARSRGIPVFLYPHAARPMVQYDGCIEPQPVTVMFTHTEYGAELMRRIGYPYPVEAAGWSYSEIRPFVPITDVRRVLFAPIHPNANGWLSPVDKDLNRRAYDALSAYCRESGAALSVRMIGTPEDNGLESDVDHHTGKKNNSADDMSSADVVVAHQTFAYMAVALGKPCVMFGEDVPPRSGNSDESFCYVSHWDSYKDDLMFPLDILSGNIAEVIGRAAAGCRQVEQWKQRFIGYPFDGDVFCKKLEAYL